MNSIGYVSDECATVKIIAPRGVELSLDVKQTDFIRGGQRLCVAKAGADKNELVLDIKVEEFDTMTGDGCAVKAKASSALEDDGSTSNFEGLFWIAPQET